MKNYPTVDRETDEATAPQRVYMMVPPDAEEGLDVVELAYELWRRKWIIVGIAAIFSCVGVIYALSATPIYRAEVVLAPTRSEQRPNLSGQLGGLASIAGVNLRATGDTREAVATLRSRAFIEEFIQEERLLPLLFEDQWDPETEDWIYSDSERIPDIRDAVDLFVEQIRSIREDSTSGLVTMSVEWKNPELAAKWAGQLVDRINERLRSRDLDESQRRLEYLNRELQNANLVELRQAISRLVEEQVQTIMLAQAETEYAFRVIDPPRIPKERIWPNRTLIVLGAFAAGSFLGVAFALVLYGIRRRVGHAD